MSRNVLVSAFMVLAAAVAPLRLYSQQNLFNIPSGDITPKGTYFYQHQVNVYGTDYMESKSHFVWGLGNGFDAGVNLINVKINPTMNTRFFRDNTDPTSPAAPLLLGTLQKQFELGEQWELNIGTQAGLNFRRTQVSNNPFAHFSYGLVRWDWHHALRITGGVYATNNQFVGTGTNTGIMAGFELPLTRDIYLMGDFVSGNHPSAVAVMGGMVNLSKRIQLCAGYLLPSPSSPAKQGVVFELNVLGFDAYEE